MKNAFLLALRFLLSFVVMLVAFMAASTIVPSGSLQLTPEETSQSGVALLIVCLVNSVVLSYLILHSRWSGMTLVAAVIVVQFGVETFMSQIETVFFNTSVRMTTEVLASVIASGFLRALIFAPLAVLIWGKRKGIPGVDKPSGLPSATGEWIGRFALLAVAYLVVYILFGYFVAWQFEVVREYYTGTTTILPFHVHLFNMLTGDAILPLFQLFRGVLWAALALVIVRMTSAKPWQLYGAVAFTFAILLSSGLLFPNPYMPAPVRMAHWLELTSSMLPYGMIAAWVWTHPAVARPVLQHQGT